MCKYIKVFPSFNNEENDAVFEDLKRLRELNNVVFEFSNASAVLRDRIDLPAIITDVGDRVDGLGPVRRFLGGQIRKAQMNV